MGYESININRLGDVARIGRSFLTKVIHKTLLRKYSKVNVFDYKDAVPFFSGPEDRDIHTHPCIFPNWDHSPRSMGKRLILHNSTPELFRKHLRNVIGLVSHKPIEERIVFVKSWNEWGEGNYMEPDLKFGKAYLEVLKEEIEK